MHGHLVGLCTLVLCIVATSAMDFTTIASASADLFEKEVQRRQSFSNEGLDKYMSHLANSSECNLKPIFMSVARVQSPLYWHLIEGYFHSMMIFGHLPCAVLVCISGPLLASFARHELCVVKLYLFGDATTTATAYSSSSSSPRNKGSSILYLLLFYNLCARLLFY